MGQAIAGWSPDGLEICLPSWIPYFFEVGRRQASGDNAHKKLPQFSRQEFLFRPPRALLPEVLTWVGVISH